MFHRRQIIEGNEAPANKNVLWLKDGELKEKTPNGWESLNNKNIDITDCFETVWVTPDDSQYANNKLYYKNLNSEKLCAKLNIDYSKVNTGDKEQLKKMMSFMCEHSIKFNLDYEYYEGILCSYRATDKDIMRENRPSSSDFKGGGYTFWVNEIIIPAYIQAELGIVLSENAPKKGKVELVPNFSRNIIIDSSYDKDTILDQFKTLDSFNVNDKLVDGSNNEPICINTSLFTLNHMSGNPEGFYSGRCYLDFDVVGTNISIKDIYITW